MSCPGKAEMIQQDIYGELRLEFRALVDRQRHDAVAQNLMGEFGQLMPDEYRSLAQDIGGNGGSDAAVGGAHIVDRHGIGVSAEGVLQ